MPKAIASVIYGVQIFTGFQAHPSADPPPKGAAQAALLCPAPWEREGVCWLTADTHLWVWQYLSKLLVSEGPRLQDQVSFLIWALTAEDQ